MLVLIMLVLIMLMFMVMSHVSVGLCILSFVLPYLLMLMSLVKTIL